MKKKQIVLAVSGFLVIGQLFTGCGAAKEVTKTVLQNKAKEETTEEETAKENKEEKTEDAKAEGATLTDAPVIGQEGIEGYEGFSYLYDELLMTESKENPETGKMESHKLTVYIPKNEYNSVDRGRAYADKLGVQFKVELNPYLQYEQENYLPEENLQIYLEEQYDEFYTTDYEDLVVSDVAKEADGSAGAIVSYCRYMDWEEDYDVVYTYINLRELDNGISFLTEITVNAKDATGKTPELLKELEAFYLMKLDWSKEAADKKLADFKANNTGDSKSFSTGYLLFDLPKGWAEDDAYSSYDNIIYAPGGDMETAGCAIGFVEEYVGEGIEDLSDLLQDESMAKEFVDSFVAELGDSYTMEYIGETCIGDTTAITVEEGTGEDANTLICYLAGKGDSLYCIQAITTPGATEDAVAVAKTILENGKLR